MNGQVSLTFGTSFINSLNISRKYYDFDFNSYRKKYIARFSRINTSGSKFEHAINKVKVNQGSSFVQYW